MASKAFNRDQKAAIISVIQQKRDEEYLKLYNEEKENFDPTTAELEIIEAVKRYREAALTVNECSSMLNKLSLGTHFTSVTMVEVDEIKALFIKRRLYRKGIKSRDNDFTNRLKSKLEIAILSPSFNYEKFIEENSHLQ